MTPLVDAAAVAEYLGCERGWVYEHADSLGARRLGSGPRARLRFSLEEVDARLTVRPAGRESGEHDSRMVEPIRHRRATKPLGTGVELLPIRGSAVRDDRSQRADARDTAGATEMAASTGRAERPPARSRA